MCDMSNSLFYFNAILYELDLVWCLRKSILQWFDMYPGFINYNFKKFAYKSYREIISHTWSIRNKLGYKANQERNSVHY